MISALAPFLAGLGLFFTGVHFIAANLTPLVGRRFRKVLSLMSDSPWVAALGGTLAGAVTQSSNAVTYVAVGLVNANAIDLRKAILLPTWSHVGTAALVILVAVDFRVAASYVLAIAGIGIYFGLSRNDQSRSAINILLGAGLLFLGMEMLKSGAGPLRDLLIKEGVVDYVATATWLSMLFGAALTAACQSSTVVGAIAVAATNIGLIDFNGACWLIYGANLGSAFNHYLLARGYEGEARQVALMQCFQKIAGYVGLLLALAVGTVIQQPVIDMAAGLVSNTPAGKVAAVFLAYQLIGSLTCTIAFQPLLRLLGRIAPRSPLQEMSKPQFLLDDALIDPSLALELATREEGRLAQRLPMMLDGIRSDAVAGEAPSEVLHAASHSITDAMAAYIESILESNADRDDRERVIRLQHRAANLRSLFDALSEFRVAVLVAREWPSSASVAENMTEALHALLSALVDATGSEDAAEREFVLALLGSRDELMERMRQRVLRENPDLPAKAQEALFSATMLFERIVWLSRRIAMLLAAPELATKGGATLMNTSSAAVLVVDDVAENRDLLVRRLKRLGIADVEQAANGLEALAAIGKRNFDVVLLDIMMPELDGFGVLERLKAEGKVNDLPIIVISALNEIEPIVRCIELGAEDFIFKPFNPVLLRARVLATLEKKLLRDQTREELRRKRMELNEARTLQLALVPPPFNDTVAGRQVTIDVVLEPAKEVGGDLVDHFRLSDDKIVVALGDVSDKGAGAALMMARTHSLIRGLSSRPDASDLFGAPEKALNIVNAALASGNETCMFVTFLLGVLDVAGNRLTYVRAGHVPPFLRRAGGSIERLGHGGGLPLGMMEGTVYKPATVGFSSGDALLILTDGFTEAADLAGALFGEARIEQYLASHDPKSPGLLEALLKDVRSFEAGQPAFDDKAAVLLSLT